MRLPYPCSQGCETICHQALTLGSLAAELESPATTTARSAEIIAETRTLIASCALLSSGVKLSQQFETGD